MRSVQAILKKVQRKPTLSLQDVQVLPSRTITPLGMGKVHNLDLQEQKEILDWMTDQFPMRQQLLDKYQVRKASIVSILIIRLTIRNHSKSIRNLIETLCLPVRFAINSIRITR